MKRAVLAGVDSIEHISLTRHVVFVMKEGVVYKDESMTENHDQE